MKAKGTIVEIRLTEEQIKQIAQTTGIDMTELRHIKMTAQELSDLITGHDPDKHDGTVGASK